MGPIKPRIIRASCLEGAKKARGVAVIIDVFRAFSCAPLLFYLGARRLILEPDPNKALALKNQISGAILVGEVNEVPIEGGDMGNSPSEALMKGKTFFYGKTVIHRTTAGVTGAYLAAECCETIVLGGFVTARAIADYIVKTAVPEVTLVAMGSRGKVPSPEDEACADLIEHLITGSPYDHIEAIESIMFHESTKKFLRGTKAYLPREDPVFCLQKNIFDFVLIARKKNGVMEAKPVVI